MDRLRFARRRSSRRTSLVRSSLVGPDRKQQLRGIDDRDDLPKHALRRSHRRRLGRLLVVLGCWIVVGGRWND